MKRSHLQADLPYLHALYSVRGIGCEKLTMLMATFSDARSAWEASADQLSDAGLPDAVVLAIQAAHESLDPNAHFAQLKNLGIQIVTPSHEHYPMQIIIDGQTPPPLLYVRGNSAALQELSVAIVGSRKYSNYGKQSAARLAEDLVDVGIHVVSGLALGIDSVAHRSALSRRGDAKGSITDDASDSDEPQTTCDGTGVTIAVLAGGIDDDTIAPRTHVQLARDILSSGGALISIYPPGTSASKGTFPARNEIMARLSSATIVIEAAAQSGTLITAQCAGKFGRPLFAIPGSIFAQESVGANSLIKSGQASLLQDVDDVVSALHVTVEGSFEDQGDGSSSSKQKVSRKIFNPSNDDERSVYSALAKHPEGLSIDKIIRETTLKGATVSQTLVMLEISDAVTHLGGGVYAVK